MVGAFEQMRRFGLVAVVVLAVLAALAAPSSAYADGSDVLPTETSLPLKPKCAG